MMVVITVVIIVLVLIAVIRVITVIVLLILIVRTIYCSNYLWQSTVTLFFLFLSGLGLVIVVGNPTFYASKSNILPPQKKKI